jgi:hypothetical protein
MKKLFHRGTQADNTVYVVSGLPYSGTALMMQLLTAGGLSPLTDNARLADGDNRKGYYEFAPVKDLPESNVAWVAGARGKVVKVISHLLPYLPSDYNYNAFLGHTLDLHHMAAVIDPKLYRQRTKSRDRRGARPAGDRAHPGGGAALEAGGRSQTPWPARDRE